MPSMQLSTLTKHQGVWCNLMNFDKFWFHLMKCAFLDNLIVKTLAKHTHSYQYLSLAWKASWNLYAPAKYHLLLIIKKTFTKNGNRRIVDDGFYHFAAVVRIPVQTSSCCGGNFYSDYLLWCTVSISFILSNYHNQWSYYL